MEEDVDEEKTKMGVLSHEARSPAVRGSLVLGAAAVLVRSCTLLPFRVGREEDSGWEGILGADHLGLLRLATRRGRSWRAERDEAIRGIDLLAGFFRVVVLFVAGRIVVVMAVDKGHRDAA